MPRCACRPLSTPPIRLPRPPARTRPVISRVSIIVLGPGRASVGAAHNRVHRRRPAAPAHSNANAPAALSAVAESIATAFRLVADADPALVRIVALSFAVSGGACLAASGLG